MKHLCVFGYVRILKYPTSKQISQYSQYFVFIFSFARGENNIQQNLSSTFLSLSSNKTKFKGGKKESHRPGPSGTECGQVALLKFFKSNEIWDNKSQIYTKIKGGGAVSREQLLFKWTQKSLLSYVSSIVCSEGVFVHLNKSCSDKNILL